MIFVRRVDGYARALQVGQADDARFFPSDEIAQQYDDQCFFITAEIIRRLATKRPDRLFPNHTVFRPSRQPQSLNRTVNQLLDSTAIP